MFIAIAVIPACTPTEREMKINGVWCCLPTHSNLDAIETRDYVHLGKSFFLATYRLEKQLNKSNKCWVIKKWSV